MLSFRCQEALDWRKRTKGGCGFPFVVRAVLIELSWVAVLAPWPEPAGSKPGPGSRFYGEPGPLGVRHIQNTQ